MSFAQSFLRNNIVIVGRQLYEKTMSLKYHTPYTKNLARVLRIILGPCTDLLRALTMKEITKSNLKNKVQSYIVKSRLPPINHQQMQVIYGENYLEFDIEILYFLLRYISGIKPHNNQWGSNPSPDDRSVSANVERILLMQNAYYLHYKDLSISDTVFDEIWKVINRIVMELEGSLGSTTDYQNSLIELRFLAIDMEEDKTFTKILRVVGILQENVESQEGNYLQTQQY